MQENYTSKPMRIVAIRYDGTNAAELVGVYGGVVDENGAPVLAIYGEGSAATIQPGQVVFMDPLQGLRMLEGDSFAIQWQLTASLPSIAAVRSGTAALPTSLLAGATKPVEVTLNGSMPSADYAAVAIINQPSDTPLGAIQIIGVATSRTTSKVTVFVRNTGLTAITSPAATVTVIATAPPA